MRCITKSASQKFTRVCERERIKVNKQTCGTGIVVVLVHRYRSYWCAANVYHSVYYTHKRVRLIRITHRFKSSLTLNAARARVHTYVTTPLHTHTPFFWIFSGEMPWACKFHMFSIRLFSTNTSIKLARLREREQEQEHEQELRSVVTLLYFASVVCVWT